MGGKTSNESKRKYNEKSYDRIQLVVKKGKKEEIKSFAESKGYSLNGFVNEAIDEKMRILSEPAAPSAPESSGELSLPAEELNKDVSALPLGVREYNVIKRAGCNTIGELINYLSSDNCAIKKDGHFYRNIKAAVEGLHAETAPEDPNQIGE